MYVHIRNIRGVSQSYSLGGSSDAACRCQYCSKLFIYSGGLQSLGAVSTVCVFRNAWLSPKAVCQTCQRRPS